MATTIDWVLRSIGSWLSRTDHAVPALPAVNGASDVELVQVVRRRAIDGSDEHRHRALMLIYSGSGGK
jgi:hypothetical protein